MSTRTLIDGLECSSCRRVGLERVGINLSTELMEDYLHLWKLVGCVISGIILSFCVSASSLVIGGAANHQPVLGCLSVGISFVLRFFSFLFSPFPPVFYFFPFPNILPLLRTPLSLLFCQLSFAPSLSSPVTLHPFLGSVASPLLSLTTICISPSSSQCLLSLSAGITWASRSGSTVTWTRWRALRP